MALTLLIPDWQERIDSAGCIDGLTAAVSIARHSTTMQDSVEDQHADNEETAIDENLIIVAQASDEAVSRSILERPGIQAALDLNRQGVRAVIVTRLDRALGEPYQVSPILNVWRQHQVRLFDLTGERPYTTAEGRLAIEDEAVKSKAEIIKLHARVRRSMRRKARTRYVGRPPFGLRMKPLAYVVDSTTGERVGVTQQVVDGKVIRSGEVMLDDRVYNGRSAAEWLLQIFEWMADGTSPPEIARRLSAADVRTGNGRTDWTHEAVRKIIRNEQYLGVRTWGRRSVETWEGKTEIKFRDKADRGFLELETGLGEIVPVELWDRANAVLKGRPRGGGRLPGGARKNPPRLLDGLVYHVADQNMMVSKQDRHRKADGTRVDRWRYTCHAAPGKFSKLEDGSVLPRCSREFQISENRLLNALQGFAQSNARSDELESFYLEHDSRLPDKIQAQRAAISTMDAKWQRVLAGYENELYTIDEMKQRKAKWIAERTAAENVLKTLLAQQSEMAQLSATSPVREALHTLIKSVIASSAPIDVKRADLADLIHRIYVDGANIQIWFRRSPMTAVA